MALDDTEMPVSVGRVGGCNIDGDRGKSSTGSGTETVGKKSALMDTDIKGRKPLLKHTLGYTNATIY